MASRGPARFSHDFPTQREKNLSKAPAADANSPPTTPLRTPKGRSPSGRSTKSSLSSITSVLSKLSDLTKRKNMPFRTRYRREKSLYGTNASDYGTERALRARRGSGHVAPGRFAKVRARIARLTGRAAPSS